MTFVIFVIRDRWRQLETVYTESVSGWNSNSSMFVWTGTLHYIALHFGTLCGHFSQTNQTIQLSREQM